MDLNWESGCTGGIARAQELFQPPSPRYGADQVGDLAELGSDYREGVDCGALRLPDPIGSGKLVPARVGQVDDEAPAQDDGGGDDAAVSPVYDHGLEGDGQGDGRGDEHGDDGGSHDDEYRVQGEMEGLREIPALVWRSP